MIQMPCDFPLDECQFGYSYVKTQNEENTLGEKIEQRRLSTGREVMWNGERFKKG